MVHLTNLRTKDGSRLFATLPQSVLWYGVYRHVATLRDAEPVGFLCDGVTEAWIDFLYRGHHFSINDQFGEYWFFVADPDCPDDILNEVVQHFTKLLLHG